MRTRYVAAALEIRGLGYEFTLGHRVGIEEKVRECCYFASCLKKLRLRVPNTPNEHWLCA